MCTTTTLTRQTHFTKQQTTKITLWAADEVLRANRIVHVMRFQHSFRKPQKKCKKGKATKR